MSAILIHDEIVHYEVLGRGRPLVFLHDWVGSWRYWIPTMQAASASFRAYAIDLWGFGDSAKNTKFYSIEQQINLLDAFLESLGIGKIAIIGHGLGAVVALLYTTRNPQIVDRMMAVGLPANSASINSRLQFASPTELMDWLLGSSTVSDAVRQEAPKADPKAILFSLASLADYDLNSYLNLLTTPCLLVYGQNDPAINGQTVEQMATLSANTHHITLDESGHYPMLDEPSKFNRLMNDFLNLSSGESPRQLQLKEEWKRRIR